MVCTLLPKGAILGPAVIRTSLQEFARFPLLQHLAVSFCKKPAAQQGSQHWSCILQMECSLEDFRHLKTLRLNGLHEIVINPAFTGLVARLEELEVTDLKNLIPQGALEAPLLRRFTYDYGCRPDVDGSQYPLTGTHSLRELTWHGDAFRSSVREAAKLAKLATIKLHLLPGFDVDLDPEYNSGYGELRDVDLPALRALKMDYFEDDPPFVLNVFIQFPGLESLDIHYKARVNRGILPSYGFLENLHFLKITTDEVDLGSGLQFLKALKVLHLDVKLLRGQLESNSLEVLKAACKFHSAEKVGPLGYLPRLRTVELRAPLNTRMELLALAYGLGGLGNLRSLVLLRKPDSDGGGDQKSDIDFFEIILQGLSNRQSQFDRIVLLDACSICLLRSSMMPRVRHLEIECKAAGLHESCHGRYDWMDDTAFLRLRMSVVGHPGIAPLVENLKQLKHLTMRRKLKPAPWDDGSDRGSYMDYVEAKREDSGLTPEYLTPLWTVDSENV